MTDENNDDEEDTKQIVVIHRRYEVRQAFHLLMSLTDEERAGIFCWFCRVCSRYVPPGDACRCPVE